MLSALLLGIISSQSPAPASIQATAQTVPQRILYNVTQDLSSSATITWRTDAPTPGSLGQIADASADPRFVAGARSIFAETSALQLPSGQTVYYHTARFTGLEPDRLYHYRVGSEVGWSEWVQFRTAKSTPAPFEFVYFGDAQNDVKSMWSRVIRQSFREAPKAAFMLHAGDLINKPTADEEWGEWFYAGGWIHNQTPTFATPGNHEYQTVDGRKVISPFWKPQFAMPENGPAELLRSTFFMDYQGVRFISLNSNERIPEQAAWLDKVLAENQNKWAIVTFHHPVYSTAAGRDNPLVRHHWAPILEKHNVALVLQGHDHTYGRRNVPTGISGTSAKSGTVYVVSVSGPKMYRLGEETRTTMPRRAEFTQLYQIIRVAPDKIRYEAFTSTGELYDSFEIAKNINGTNRFINIPVKSPERIEKTPAMSRSGS